MSSNKNYIENELIELNIKIGEAEKQRQEDFLKGVLSSVNKKCNSNSDNNKEVSQNNNK